MSRNSISSQKSDPLFSQNLFFINIPIETKIWKSTTPSTESLIRPSISVTQRLYLGAKGYQRRVRLVGTMDRKEGSRPFNFHRLIVSKSDRSVGCRPSNEKQPPIAVAPRLMHPLYSPPSKIIIKMFHGRRMLGGVPLVCSERIQDGWW